MNDTTIPDSARDHALALDDSLALESSRRLADMLRRENSCRADSLVALAEFDDAGSYRRLGYANLFDYLHRELLLPRS